MIRIVVIGSRSWENAFPIRKALIQLTEGKNKRDFLIITGGAPGVDTITEKEAKRLGIHVARIDALWSRYERAAGPIRNGVMLSLNPSLVLAFHWDLENESSGTRQCLEQARRRGLRTKLLQIPKKTAMPSGFPKKKRKKA